MESACPLNHTLGRREAQKTARLICVCAARRAGPSIASHTARSVARQKKGADKDYLPRGDSTAEIFKMKSCLRASGRAG